MWIEVRREMVRLFGDKPSPTKAASQFLDVFVICAERHRSLMGFFFSGGNRITKKNITSFRTSLKPPKSWRKSGVPATFFWRHNGVISSPFRRQRSSISHCVSCNCGLAISAKVSRWSLWWILLAGGAEWISLLPI